MSSMEPADQVQTAGSRDMTEQSNRWQNIQERQRKYIIEQRIKKAMQLILSNEFHMCDIAEMCGYNSESYFLRDFKKHTGVSPSKFY